jgi:predicted AlkP superfamily pyrophosphatase or phosphodiesterase
LPAGHSATAAYWFDTKEGKFITSTYYTKELPQWVTDFNDQKWPAKLTANGWNTLLPIDQYTESTSDDQAYETKFAGEEKAVFPHSIAGKAGDPYGVLPATPFGNTLTKEMALAAIKNENMGKNEATDFLAVSFSSPDYVGHAFGPNSIEEEDTFLRLDKDLEEMLTYLDNWVGKDKYLVFLSADHGVMDIPGFWKQNKLPAGNLDMVKLKAEVRKTLVQAYGEGDYIKSENNYQIYLNQSTLAAKSLTIEQIYRTLRPMVLKYEGIADFINLQDLGNSHLNDHQLSMFKNLHHATRGGDLGFLLQPGWFASSNKTGTTHGTAYNYDTHVPFILYGWKIPAGQTNQLTQIADISATLADLLNILAPNGCIGKPIQIFK